VQIAGRSSQICRARGEDGRPRVRLSIRGIQATALVDTGSTHTLIDSSVYYRLPRLTPMYSAPILVSLTNHELPIRGACTLSLAGFPCEVLICDSLGVDLLIGADLCRSAIIDFQNGMLTLGDQKFPMQTTRENCFGFVASCVPRAPQKVVNDVIDAYRDVFSTKATPVNVARSLQPAEIDTGDHPPIKQNPYRMPLLKRQIVEDCVAEMLRDNVIQPSVSPYASPVVLIPKRDGSTRFCVDYRKLNAITRKDAHPLPLIQDVFDQVAGSKIFSTLDLRSGYWQVPMESSSIPKTAFTCHLGLFEFVRMPFGLTNAPAIFQRAMNKVLSGLIGRCCMVYIDDIVVFSRTPEEHARHLEQVLERFRGAGLQLKPSKCNFGLPQIELLGHSVSADGITPLPQRVEAIKNLAPPENVTAIRSFIGTCSFYRNYIPGFSTLASPLTDLTKKKEPFRWGHEQQHAFDALKTALTQAPILAHPDVTKPYVLYTDASNKAIGAILVQKDDAGVERVISYLSHKLSGAQLKWSTIEKEAYAIIYALKKFHAYLWGAKFEIHTDHKPLRSLFKSEIKNSKLERWSINISLYGAPIIYHPGKLNIRADMLSRIAAVQPRIQTIPPDDIPDVWITDGIDANELAKRQREQFPDAFIEASQDTDETCYIVEQGLLYTLAEPSFRAGRYLRLLLPQQYRQRVIDRCHAEVGHSALAKTLSRIQEHYIWPGMRKFVREYIRHCVKCNTITPSNPAHPRGTVPVPPAPFHTWGIDLVGPFPRDRRGRQYLMTCVDHLTGWAEAIPIASKNAESVQDAFLHNIVARYGLPSILISDNGGEFCNANFDKWLREFGVSHRLTSPYHPQTNGMTERFNGTIQKLLLKLTGGDPRKWTKHLSEALYAYRITQNASGLSPYQAVYGQKPRLPKANMGVRDEGERLRAIRLAEKILGEFRSEQKQSYKEHEPKRAKCISPGTYVAIRVLNPKKGETKWQPGYQVISSHDGALRLTELSTGNIIRLNQRHVREIPASKPYDEIDPLPKRDTRPPEDFVTVDAKPIDLSPDHPLPTRIPAINNAVSSPDDILYYFPCDDWTSWLDFLSVVWNN